MSSEKYNEIEEFFNKQDIEDFGFIRHCYEETLKKKLWYELDENHKYKFKYPIPYHDINFLLQKKKYEVIELHGKKEKIYYGEETNNIDSYEYNILLRNKNDKEYKEMFLDMDDNTTLSLIIEAIKSDKDFKKRSKRSKSIYFENEDIIITDPCYIMKKNPYEYPSYEKYGINEELCNKKFYDMTEEEKGRFKSRDNDPYYVWERKNNDWDKCAYGEDMEVLGIKNYLTHDTIYGDWSCTSFDSDTKEIIGKFCADAGEVSVFSLNEVRAYNPDIDKWIEEHDWCVTKIPNFTGEVYIDVVCEKGVYEDTTEYHEKGEEWEDYEVHVIGKGTTNFITSQTGL